MLSQKTRYSIRALQHLADHVGTGPVPLGEIAEKQRIPKKFLTVLLSEMGRSGLVSAQRGRDGGYWLAKDPTEISYGDIVRLTRGSLALVPCASRWAYESCTSCVDEEGCRLRMVMLTVRDATADILDGLTLADDFKAFAADKRIPALSVGNNVTAEQH